MNENTRRLSKDQNHVWSVLSHLTFLLDYPLPLGGLVSLIIIYKTIGTRDAAVRENARLALNLELTTLIVSFGGLAAILLAHVSQFSVFGLLGGITLVMILAFNLYRLVAGIQAALAVSRGEAARYTYAANLIKRRASNFG